MREADSTTPDLQYVVKIDVIGMRRLAAIVASVKVQRIAEIRPDGAPVLAATSAESCFSGILTMLELPAGGPATMETVLRYEDCQAK